MVVGESTSSGRLIAGLIILDLSWMNKLDWQKTLLVLHFEFPVGAQPRVCLCESLSLPLCLSLIHTHKTHTGFEELDPSIPLHGSAAFYNMVKALVEAGYERNVTSRCSV